MNENKELSLMHDCRTREFKALVADLHEAFNRVAFDIIIKVIAHQKRLERHKDKVGGL